MGQDGHRNNPHNSAIGCWIKNEEDSKESPSEMKVVACSVQNDLKELSTLLRDSYLPPTFAYQGSKSK